jgi:hypothetical protein
MFLGSLIDIVPLLKVEGSLNQKKVDAVEYSCNAIRLHVNTGMLRMMRFFKFNVHANNRLLI